MLLLDEDRALGERSACKTYELVNYNEPPLVYRTQLLTHSVMVRVTLYTVQRARIALLRRRTLHRTATHRTRPVSYFYKYNF